MTIVRISLPQNKKLKQGFTLVEMVVAVSVFAVISIASYSTMNTVLNGREIINQKNQEISSLQRMHALLKNDLRYAINHSVKNEFGENSTIFSANENGQLFAITTLYPRPFDQGKLKRVFWTFENNKVWRNETSVIDSSEEVGINRREIISNVEQVDFYFFEKEDLVVQRKTIWDNNDSLPVAIELELELSSKKNYRWFFGGPSL